MSASAPIQFANYKFMKLTRDEVLAEINAGVYTSNERLFMLDVSGYARDNGRCWCGIKTFAQRLNITPRSISRLISQLCEKGVLERFWEGGRYYLRVLLGQTDLRSDDRRESRRERRERPAEYRSDPRRQSPEPMTPESGDPRLQSHPNRINEHHQEQRGRTHAQGRTVTASAQEPPRVQMSDPWAEHDRRRAAERARPIEDNRQLQEDPDDDGDEPEGITHSSAFLNQILANYRNPSATSETDVAPPESVQVPQSQTSDVDVDALFETDPAEAMRLVWNDETIQRRGKLYPLLRLTPSRRKTLLEVLERPEIRHQLIRWRNLVCYASRDPRCNGHNASGFIADLEAVVNDGRTWDRVIATSRMDRR